jgi:ferrous-iron efflux pump FieF
MLLSVTATFFLVLFLNYVAKKTNSLVIKSDALHYKTDLVSNIAIIVVLIAVNLTGYYQIDFIVSIFIALYIFKEALELVKEGFLNLLDISLDFQTVEKIKDIIKKQILVLDYHCLRTRQAGNRNFVDVHLVMTPDMKLKMAHAIIEQVEEKIRNIDNNRIWVINIHADPYDDSSINKMQEEC